jgi:hypothetical protein
MNPNWLGVVSLVLAIVAFFFAYRAVKPLSFKHRVWIALASVVLSIPGITYSLYYGHWVEVPSWYYQFRSIAGTELMVVWIGVAGAAVAALMPRIFLILPLLGVAVFATVPVIKPFIGPIPKSAFKDRWVNDVCLQTTPSTCGAASLATVMKRLGDSVSESEVAAAAHSYQGGTEAWYLARFARSRGYDVDFDLAPGFDPDGGLPAVVGVKLGEVGHFIAILGKESDQYIVGEPVTGRKLMTQEMLMKAYRFTGFHMRVRDRHSKTEPASMNRSN